MSRALRLLLFCTTALSAVGQQVHTGPTGTLPSAPAGQTIIIELPLELSGELVHTQEWVSGFMGPIACDAEDNAYVRLLAGTGSAFENPVVRISRKGSSARFEPSKVPGISGKQIYVFNYAVEDSGRMYQLVGLPEEELDGRTGLVYLVAFSRDGDYLWKSKFKTVFEVNAFVPLPNGDFLLAGMDPPKRSEEGKPLPRTSFTGIFGSDGQLKRPLKPVGDKPAGKDQRPDDPGATPVLRFDDVKLGDDGNLYILQPSSAPRVFVLELSGKTARVLTVKPPFPDSMASALFVSGNRLLIEYQYQKASSAGKKPEVKTIYSLYDAQTGELLVNYRPAFLGTVACLNQDRLTVLQGGSDRHFAIAHALLP